MRLAAKSSYAQDTEQVALLSFNEVLAPSPRVREVCDGDAEHWPDTQAGASFYRQGERRRKARALCVTGDQACECS
jgi:hypothetical protein